jgi:polyisoprenoid-binding protein YceI
VASLDIADEGFRAHLLGDDFFAADRYPAITFTSRSIVRDGDALTVAGELTIKDVTRPVQARGTMADGAVDPFDNVRLGLTLATTIDRSDFGIAWNRKLVTGGFAIANRVDLTLDLAFIRT